MAQCMYACGSGATFWNSLGSPALQTAIAISSSSTDYGIQLKKYRIGFNGVTAANTPVLVRFFTYTAAAAGTSTSSTITQESGLRIASTNFLAGFNYTVEPTVKTYLGDGFSLTPNGGSVIYDFQQGGDEPDYFNSGGMGFGMEILPVQTVGVQCALWFTRI